MNEIFNLHNIYTTRPAYPHLSLLLFIRGAFLVNANATTPNNLQLGTIHKRGHVVSVPTTTHFIFYTIKEDEKNNCYVDTHINTDSYLHIRTSTYTHMIIKHWLGRFFGGNLMWSFFKFVPKPNHRTTIYETQNKIRTHKYYHSVEYSQILIKNI